MFFIVLSTLIDLLIINNTGSPNSFINNVAELIIEAYNSFFTFIKLLVC